MFCITCVFYYLKLLVLDIHSFCSFFSFLFELIVLANKFAYLSTFQFKRNSSTNAFGIKISLAFLNCDLKAITML